MVDFQFNEYTHTLHIHESFSWSDIVIKEYNSPGLLRNST